MSSPLEKWLARLTLDQMRRESEAVDRLMSMPNNFRCPECDSRGMRGSICIHPEPIGQRFRV